MALEAKPPGGGLVRSLLLGAYPMPFVTPPTIPLTKGSNYMVRLATGSPVVQLPVVPANHVRIFGPTVFTGSPGTFSLDLIDASLAVFQLVNGLGATGNNLVFPALVAGETIRFTLANPPNLINISVSYLDVPVEVALGNTPIPVRHVFTDLTPFSIPAPAAGFTRRPWAPLGVAFDSGRAAVSGSTFGSTALWGCNPDTTNATFAQVKSDLAALIDIQLGNSVVAPTTPLAALGFGSSLINEQQTATITKTSVVTVRPPCVVGVYADVPLSP
jgi:hypothetical protein